MVALCIAAGATAWVMLRRRKRRTCTEEQRNGSALVQVSACSCVCIDDDGEASCRGAMSMRGARHWLQLGRFAKLTWLLLH